ncbi:MAG: NAD(P)H-hydrate dehydratase [Rhodospirillaceae bacterium]|jgi:ADP-dependent NAD(P)H-hydrate dehydratase / NAD(P)H-hydrate epimerase|nr:NAD(P)H-hydrate dehydratase [Rhodospirillaceae bacterium]MBT5458517.1 NAD(P)H-hydrate dehydratase [Rhodospirillaceae bacterium]
MAPNDIKSASGDEALELLTVAQMYRADEAAIASGTSGQVLMENAGQAIADQIRNRWARRPISILCGPGKNGGDGFVVARLLADEGWPITLALLGEKEALKGDAAWAAAQWSGAVHPPDPSVLDGAELVVDALFGAGLSRPLDDMARILIDAINDRRLPCVAVDIPSGVHGDTGQVLGGAPSCRLTVTFFRRKPGHLLMPGRAFAGETVVAPIGIPESVLEQIEPETFANGPGLWLSHYPWPALGDHKYGRGHALIAGGASMTGAARLAARAAYRAGAGMVTIASPPSAVQIYAGDLAGLLVSAVANEDEFNALLVDPRKNAALVGPGCGVSRTTRNMALGALRAQKAVVLDADALSVFQDNPGDLFDALLDSSAVLTPHDGEFARLFDQAGDKLSRVRAAAARCGAVVVLKGPDTVIAAPDGRAIINDNAPPTLATAGTGDVLAGLILGLMAQGMGPFDAACAGVWLHGAAATQFGPGLIASDIPEMVPAILNQLHLMDS